MNDNQPDFLLAPLEVMQDHRLTLMQTRVLLALFSFRNKKTNLAKPKRETLAKRAGYSISVISRTTSQLVKLGWLNKEGDGGRRRASSYEIIVPDFSTETVTESVTVTEPVTVTESVTKTVTESVRGNKEQNNEQSYKRKYIKEKNIPKTSVPKPTTIPDNFTPNAANQAYAAKHGIDLADVLETFRNNTSANGKMYVNWHAGLGTYLQNAKKWREEKQAAQPQVDNVHGINGAYAPPPVPQWA